MSAQQPRVAIAHDWLTNMGGSEKLLLAIAEHYPGAPIYTSVYDRKKMPPEFSKLNIKTTWLQKLPLLKYKHQLVAPLRAKAFESFNFDDFDIVLSITSSDAKGIKVDPKKTLHICYCNTPTRYYWSHYEEYKKQPGFGKLNFLVKLLLPVFVRFMRRWDYAAAQRVAVFIGNSTNVSERIKKYYNRDSYTLFPAVNFDNFKLGKSKRDGLLVVGRQISYKKVDHAIEAANSLKLRLTVIGGGPEHEKLVKLAGPTVVFLRASDKELAAAYAGAKLLLFPGEEDGGIVPLEAMASGTPVVAYKKGGVLDAVVDGSTGVLYEPQSVAALTSAIQEGLAAKWDHGAIRAHAELFSKQNFLAKLSSIVEQEYSKFRN